ncbi:hypothetical protein KIPB_013801, partial [Kipferlia bialata]|eukprot:g13801.t1
MGKSGKKSGKGVSGVHDETDERFQMIHSDPRFQRSKDASADGPLVVDERFSDMLSKSEFREGDSDAFLASKGLRVEVSEGAEAGAGKKEKKKSKKDKKEKKSKKKSKKKPEVTEEEAAQAEAEADAE